MKQLVLLALTLASTMGVTPAFAADTYGIDAAHTRVLFKTTHLGISEFWGLFTDTSGSFSFDDAHPAKSSVSVVIKAESLMTHDAKRDGHLRSPDFFNVKQFPVITFVGKSFSKKGDQWSVTGDLSFHGTTKSVTIPFKKIGEGDDPWGGHRAGYSGQIQVKRSDYGMDFMIGGVGDEVTLTLAVEGVRK